MLLPTATASKAATLKCKKSLGVTDVAVHRLQVQLYEDFAKSRAKASVDESISGASAEEEEEKPKLKATGHVFQVASLTLSFPPIRSEADSCSDCAVRPFEDSRSEHLQRFLNS